jgi:hypothetical protein
MNSMWDERYSEEGYAYGSEPNAFFKSYIDKLPPGKLLLPAEGEGRNAVYAAKKGWNVVAFDSSEAGKDKALKLAEENKVEIEYRIESIENFNSNDKFDLIALIFVHQPPEIKKIFHTKLIDCLEDNGLIIMEVFSKKQIGRKSGGPQNIEMLSSKEDISSEFKNLKIELLKETETILNEGKYHNGEASVIRFIGKKCK